MEDVTLEVQSTESGNTAMVKPATVAANASKKDLSKLHRATLEEYGRSLGMKGSFDKYEIRGDVIDAILEFRDGGDH